MWFQYTFELYFSIHFWFREWYQMHSAFPPALVLFHASETVENWTKNRKPNNYLGYLREIGWRLSAALYNTRSNVNLVSKEGEWNETWWINENIDNADVNNSLITKMADVTQWNILLGKTNAHERITPKVSYPSPKGLNTGVPKWVHEGTLIRKLPGGDKKMQQTTKWRNKMAICEITALGTKC